MSYAGIQPQIIDPRMQRIGQILRQQRGMGGMPNTQFPLNPGTQMQMQPPHIMQPLQGTGGLAPGQMPMQPANPGMISNTPTTPGVPAPQFNPALLGLGGGIGTTGMR